jgi:predicted ferric reductase
MVKRIEDLKVIENKRLSDDFFVLVLSGSERLPELKPGQFAQVRVDGSPDTFLRRPISIHDVDFGTNTFKILIQVTGKGTQTLSRLKNGDFLNIIYPLGNSFGLPSGIEDKVLLVGGGCGIAPLLFWDFGTKTGFWRWRSISRLVRFTLLLKMVQWERKVLLQVILSLKQGIIKRSIAADLIQ